MEEVKETPIEQTKVSADKLETPTVKSSAQTIGRLESQERQREEVHHGELKGKRSSRQMKLESLIKK